MDEIILFIVLSSLFFTLSLLIIETIKSNKKIIKDDITENNDIIEDNYKGENSEYNEIDNFEEILEEEKEHKQYYNKKDITYQQYDAKANISQEKTTIDNQVKNYKYKNSDKTNEIPIFYHNYLYNYHSLKAKSICDEEYKKEYDWYASEYEDLDYYDYIGTEIDIESIFKKPSIFYHDNYFDKDYYINDNYYDDTKFNYKNNNYNDKTTSLNNSITNTNPKNIVQQSNQYNEKKSDLLNFELENKIEEYITPLLGNEIVENRKINEQETVNKNEKTNKDESIDKYLKMFFGENFDLDRLNNNDDKKDIQ